MSQPSLNRAEQLRRFSDDLDAIASRSGPDARVPSEEIDAIFAEHEAECLVLEGSEHEAQRVQGGRRV